ncbi:hypothetical protein [Ancylomarina longa]|uniref:Uncharacterized protein n=1 Tax=Ancylomarina longa TaxID=2487017 RepID=A0A434AZM8_9BACT|nr:hypothetical protein [Ancylomarina longa]RUT80079.1 hypothetical protein DLK05_01600 [Ancylomarina longa]
MKTIKLIIILLFLFPLISYSINDIEEIEKVFAETRELCNSDNGFLWGYSLEVPILFIDRQKNLIYTNQNSPKLQLYKTGNIYIGEIPDSIPSVKGIFHLDDQNWALIPLPLPKDKIKRQCIIIHEAFHYIQGKLHLNPQPYNNQHMDEMEARFWLKLEWQALQKALVATEEAKKQAIVDALCFRKYRRALFSNCEVCENRFEIYDGLAEYTAMKLCCNKDEFISTLQRRLDKYWNTPSFVNCFAYFSAPAYAYLLDQTNLKWRANLSDKDDIALLTQFAYNIFLPTDLFLEAEERSVIYKGAQIMGEELNREFL